MASKGATAKGAAKAEGGGSVIGFIIMLVVLTVLAAGGGFVFATMVLDTGDGGPNAAKPGANSEAAKTAHGKTEEGPAAHGEHAENAAASENATEVVELAPIITNLREPKGAFIRIEASIVIDRGIENASVLTGQIAEDVIAFLRATTLAQIEGPTGLEHLREDLNDRVRVRSGGKAHEFILQTMVVE